MIRHHKYVTPVASCDYVSGTNTVEPPHYKLFEIILLVIADYRFSEKMNGCQVVASSTVSSTTWFGSIIYCVKGTLFTILDRNLKRRLFLV